MSSAGVMDGMPPGLVSPAAFWFAVPPAPGAPAIPMPAPPPAQIFPPGFLSPGAFPFAVARQREGQRQNSAAFLTFFP